ncbi:MAG TPA: hypothetical protein VFB12_08465 [Ktedonobacteraceae bacterium]|nr:hypothetical protein [Ktedonobacteraceae bacterium]
MSTIKLVVSDLHLADGSPILDCFGESQQSAFTGLLHAATSENGPLVQAAAVELIINGDCFDFLVTSPYAQQRVTDEATALEKIEKIIAAHAPFFADLRSFVAIPGRSVTFLTGNHDPELCFAKVRARICQDLVGKENDSKIYFCPTRSYRPLPDVCIEHGNHYDPWNRDPLSLWDEHGQPLLTDPPSLLLPMGTWYYQLVTNLISVRYPFIDHFEPALSHTRQIGLLCLLDPPLLLEMAQLTMQMLPSPRKALANLAPGEEQMPVRLFEEAMLDFVAFRQAMFAQLSAAQPQEQASDQISPEDFMEYMLVHEALTLPHLEALTAICTPAAQGADSTSQGMYAVLNQNPALRYAIAGHTHTLCIDPINQGQQVYLNTGSWVARYAQPAPGELTPALADWLHAPDWDNIPLRDVTQLPFTLITVDNGPASASLCVWEGGSHGHYRVLA